MKKIINPLTVAGELDEFWSPRVIGEVNDCYVKVAKLKGELAWHSHKHEDEMFMVIRGELTIEFEDKTLNLQAGDLCVVPRDTQHNPIAHAECLVMLFEPKETAHTGDVTIEKSRTIAQQLEHYEYDN